MPKVKKSEIMDEKGSQEFNDIAKTIFSPIYPVIARQILEASGITKGICVDLGSGPADLSIALARISDLEIYAVDNSDPMIEIATANITKEGLTDRIKPFKGDVAKLPFNDNTAVLAVSRGSLFFWPDRPAVYKEVHRILAPGGITFIGGGFGNARLKAQIFKKMRERFDDWDETVKDRLKKASPEHLQSELVDAGIMDFDIINDDTGFWINIKK